MEKGLSFPVFVLKNYTLKFKVANRDDVVLLNALVHNCLISPLQDFLLSKEHWLISPSCIVLHCIL